MPTPWAKLWFRLLLSIGAGAFGLYWVSLREFWGWIFVGISVVGALYLIGGMLEGGGGLLLDGEGFEERHGNHVRRRSWWQVSMFEVVSDDDGNRCIAFNDFSSDPVLSANAKRFNQGYDSSLDNLIVHGSLERACALLNAFRARALQ